MLGYNNQRVWCRSTEEKILSAFVDGVSKKISIRDTVNCYNDYRRQKRKECVSASRFYRLEHDSFETMNHVLYH